nr:hypothetical protein CFP56_00625 [Quercus suber]
MAIGQIEDNPVAVMTVIVTRATTSPISVNVDTVKTSKGQFWMAISLLSHPPYSVDCGSMVPICAMQHFDARHIATKSVVDDTFGRFLKPRCHRARIMCAHCLQRAVSRVWFLEEEHRSGVSTARDQPHAHTHRLTWVTKADRTAAATTVQYVPGTLPSAYLTWSPASLTPPCISDIARIVSLPSASRMTPFHYYPTRICRHWRRTSLPPSE